MGGGMSVLVIFGGAWLIGEASGREAHILLKMSLETMRSFCGTVTLATGNILALMLTLLSLSSNLDVDLNKVHYQRVKQIATVDTITLVAAILIYLLLNLPLGESEPSNNPSQWKYFYYGTLILSSILGGAAITVILMLFNAVRDIIHALSPTSAEPSKILDQSEAEEE